MDDGGREGSISQASSRDSGTCKFSIKRPSARVVLIPINSHHTMYTATHQVLRRDFSENIPAIESFALAVGSLADWLGNEASSKVNTRNISRQAVGSRCRVKVEVSKFHFMSRALTI